MSDHDEEVAKSIAFLQEFTEDLRAKRLFLEDFDPELIDRLRRLLVKLTSDSSIAPFIYRNRSDDNRTIDQLHFCGACGGYYGVSHAYNHCQERKPGGWGRDNCACRFCRESHGKPIQGAYGEFL